MRGPCLCLYLPIFSSSMFKDWKEDNDKEIKDLTGMVQMTER